MKWMRSSRQLAYIRLMLSNSYLNCSLSAFYLWVTLRMKMTNVNLNVAKFYDQLLMIRETLKFKWSKSSIDDGTQISAIFLTDTFASIWLRTIKLSNCSHFSTILWFLSSRSKIDTFNHFFSQRQLNMAFTFDCILFHWFHTHRSVAMTTSQFHLVATPLTWKLWIFHRPRCSGVRKNCCSMLENVLSSLMSLSLVRFKWQPKTVS